MLSAGLQPRSGFRILGVGIQPRSSHAHIEFRRNLWYYL